MSPVDANDLITAIAAQERRVLELREELSRAEEDLARLKKQWATHEVYKKRPDRRATDPTRGIDAQDETAIRRSLELDRRRALLTQQQTSQAAPERSRRRVFTGTHTRQLSLLSPTKPDGLSDYDADRSKDDSDGNNYAASAYTSLSAPSSKRASWAPRSTQTSGVKQFAQDLKTGLWMFMEDLRQATVGDEPITGQGTYRRGLNGYSTGDQHTIRASSSNSSRPRASAVFDGGAPKAVAPNGESRQDGIPMDKDASQRSQRSKNEAPQSTKRFSWTPLSTDAYDDNDWSNWDNPSGSSLRWSGTTVNGDIIPSPPEKRREPETSTPM
mgnify:FL=1